MPIAQETNDYFKMSEYALITCYVIVKIGEAYLAYHYGLKCCNSCSREQPEHHEVELLDGSTICKKDEELEKR